MLVQLKQAEIITALKQYIASQGINIRNKTVDIAFTAGRGATGLSAEIQIEDIVDDSATTTKEDTAPEPIMVNDVGIVDTAPLSVVSESDSEVPNQDAAPSPVKSLFA